MHAVDTANLLQHLFTGVIWVDDAFSICWVNNRTEQLFSVSRSRLIGLNILKLLEPCDTDQSIHSASDEDADTDNKYCENDKHAENISRLANQFTQAKNYQQPFIEYSRHIKGMAQPMFVNYSATSVEHDDRVYFLIEMWQGDRQNRLDKEHRIIEQHNVSREMLRSVAHEVKNPLAGIRGAAQLLIKQTQRQQQSVQSTPDTTTDLAVSTEPEKTWVDAEKLATYANIVISETDRLTKLIEQLLGSNQPSHFENVNIHEPLEHVRLLTNTQYPKIFIKRDYDLSLPEISADKNQLIQVFLNLVNNACQAILEQDMSTLSADYKPSLTLKTRIEHQFTIGKRHHRQVIKVCVQDNGGGIAPELMDRIFFPLVTGRASGTGLGLALVQEIVQRHQGTIEVDSQAGSTQFCIYLPLTIEDAN